MCARDSQKLAQLEHEIPAVETNVCDMSDLDLVAHFVDRILQKTPAIDLLVSNAGRASEYDLKADDLSGIDVASEINLNLAGPLKLILGLLPALKKRPGSGILWSRPAMRSCLIRACPSIRPQSRLTQFHEIAPARNEAFRRACARVAPPLVDTPAVQHKKGRKISSAEVCGRRYVDS